MWTFKHNVYEGNEILSTEEEISSLKKFKEEGIIFDVIPSLWFIGKTLNIEMVVEAEKTTVSTQQWLKGSANPMYDQFAQNFTKHSCIMWNIFPSVTSLFQQENSVNLLNW